ncbi:MAG: hypothetical protein FD167_3207, partial [bacterium]
MFKKKRLLIEILKPNALYKALALFFLLFTFVDIALFGYCGEELPFPTSCLSEVAETTIIETTSILDNELTDLITLEQQHKKHDQAPCSTDEDCCFCCCAHWVLTTRIFINKIEITLPLEQPTKIALLESPSNKTYRPPRF